jgi:hypothetical protein
MADFALVYIFFRILHRFAEFFRHWYVESFYLIGRYAVSALEQLDRTLAFRVNLEHFFEPLYQDHTVVGHIMGFLFRSSRLLIGGIIYALLIAFAAALYITWLLVPIYIIYRILGG